MGTDNRSQTEAFKRLVSLWLSAHGIPNTPRPYVVRTRLLESGEADSGHLWGIPDVLVNTRSAQKFLIGEQVDAAREEAEQDAKNYFFSVQHRKGHGDPADSLVTTDLRTLSKVLHALQRLRELEAQGAAS